MIFADTSFFYAGLASNDRSHADALALLGALERRTVFTSNHVVGECWTLLRRRWSHAAAVSFLERIESSERIGVAHVGAGLEREALAWLREHDEREYSFVDATSFALMRDRRITEALAFDGDFAAAGFIELRP